MADTPPTTAPTLFVEGKRALGAVLDREPHRALVARRHAGRKQPGVPLLVLAQDLGPVTLSDRARRSRASAAPRDAHHDVGPA